ncbi:MAG: PQQ-dependent sugar dehydrogenase [Chloroflexota bacterium]|nr:PQQ-dependent sugar dehydrogenase [Chloroflexota bacterium]
MKRAIPVSMILILWLLGATAIPSRAAIPANGDHEPLPAGARVETVLGGLSPAVTIAFDPTGRLFLTEKGGAVRLLTDGVLQPTPVLRFAVDTCSERGLLGLALDPQFAANHYVYVYYSVASDCGATVNRVARFIETDGVGHDPQTLFESPQTAGNHNGGSIHFGPDGKLYITIGDNANAANAQDLTVPNGKLHRINPDGSIPSDNPHFGAGALPSLFAIGLRNSFDFTFDSRSSAIFASENGPNCDDETNRIVAGYNYGWRAGYPCDDAAPDPAYNTIAPLWYAPQGACCIAPTGIEVYRGTRVPAWTASLFQCNYNNGALLHFRLSADRTTVLGVAAVDGVKCNTGIVSGPDGALYYLEGGGYQSSTLKRITGAAPSPVPSSTPAPVLPAPTAAPLPPTPAPGGPLIALADPLFYAAWERVDRPVREGRAMRSWTWGPVGHAALQEPFGEATRLVQYFDKGRMERNPIAGDGPSFVSNGLLVVEMLSGRIQIGATQYETRPPPTLPLGGDGAANPAPSYAAFARVASLAGENRATAAVGAPITAHLAADGTVQPGTGPVAATVAAYRSETGHNIPDLFYRYLTASGPIYDNGYHTAPVYDWVTTMGYPISEAYWTRMTIGGTAQDVLVQAYQRQILTYIPAYAAPWTVQLANVGTTYYRWRYGREP